jgi:hypothetical protein
LPCSVAARSSPNVARYAALICCLSAGLRGARRRPRRRGVPDAPRISLHASSSSSSSDDPAEAMVAMVVVAAA